MTASQKAELVAAVVGEYSLSSVLAAADLPKSTWYYYQRHKIDYGRKYAHLQPALEETARRHSEYGYRRTTTELRFAGGTQKAHLMPIIGHVSKLAFGWAVGESANRALALQAWRRARRTLQQYGIEPAGMVMHHDQDPVYTSYAWTGRLLLRDHLQISYTLDGARGNTEMEAFISRFKNENRSLLLDAPTIEVLKRIVNERMRYYNDVRRHSVLDNQPPRSWLEHQLNDVEKDR